jgi:hypothetical protein
MQFAGMIARKLKLPANPQWAVQSARPYLPVANLSGAGGAVHPEFSHYNGMPIAQVLRRRARNALRTTTH